MILFDSNLDLPQSHTASTRLCRALSGALENQMLSLSGPGSLHGPTHLIYREKLPNLQASSIRREVLHAQLSPAPCLPQRAARGGAIRAGAPQDGRTLSSWGPNLMRLPVRPGRTPILIRSLDVPGVHPLPDRDPRDFLVLIHGLRILRFEEDQK
jgi:hypothetical protein